MKIYIGIIASLISLLSVSGYFLKNSIQSQAATEQALKETTEVMANYATNVENEVYAYTMAMDSLQTEYQEARNARSELAKRLSEIDLSEMAKADPVDLEHRINRATQRMLNKISSATRADPGNAEVPKTGTGSTPTN